MRGKQWVYLKIQDLKKNSNNEIVAPNSAKFNGKTFAECQTELVNRIKSDVILSSDADGVASITNFTNVNKPDFFGDGSNIATYFFDADATDARGKYNGSATGVTYSADKFGNASVFNGTSSYITGLPTFNMTGQFSISLWFKKNGISIYTQILMGHSKTAAENASGLDERFFIYIARDAGYPDNTFSGTGSRYFTGKMDNIRFFNRPLSDVEVFELYNEGTTYFTENIDHTRTLDISYTGSLTSIDINTYILD